MKTVLLSIARDAGALMLRYFGHLREGQVKMKTSTKDLVTVADGEVESLVFERLRAAFPDHGLYGEESGEVEKGHGARFIVDPIDGTVNFAHGLQHFALSIAREESGAITHGLIYLPALDELFYAERGRGATLNERPIRVSPQANVADSVVATGFACVRAGLKPDGLPIFNHLMYRIRDLRRLGAATVDLAYVARGIFDAFYEMELSPWDVAAGLLIVEEAGGRVTGFAGADDPVYGRKILATNGRLHETLRRLIEEAIKS